MHLLLFCTMTNTSSFVEHLGNNTCLLTKWPHDDDDVLIKMICEICEKYFKLIHVL